MTICYKYSTQRLDWTCWSIPLLPSASKAYQCTWEAVAPPASSSRSVRSSSSRVRSARCFSTSEKRQTLSEQTQTSSRSCYWEKETDEKGRKYARNYMRNWRSQETNRRTTTRPRWAAKVKRGKRTKGKKTVKGNARKTRTRYNRLYEHFDPFKRQNFSEFE